MRRFLMAAALLAVAACGSDPAGLDADAIEGLFGTWDWRSANGGIAGLFLTPQTEGFTMQIVFTRPDRVELSRDGQVTESTTFQVLSTESTGGLVTGGRLRYGTDLLGWDEQTVGFDIEGGLILTDPCCDGFIYSWTRAAP